MNSESDGGGEGTPTKKKASIQTATNDELMLLCRRQGSRLKIVEEEYMKLKQKVCGF